MAFLYIIEKLLEHRCLKWARIVHLGIWNTSYGQKKGWESNCQFDSWPEKVGNRSDLLSCKQRATCRWKVLDKTYNFASTSPRSEVCSQSYWAPKSQECPLARFQDSHTGVSGEKSHLDVGPVERSRVYYNGEGGSFPQVWAVVSLMCSCCSWLVLTPKVLQLCTNHFVWFVCRPCEWVSLSTLPSPIPELQHAPLPLKVLWVRERASTPPSSDVFHLDSHLSCSRSWECVIDR